MKKIVLNAHHGKNIQSNSRISSIHSSMNGHAGLYENVERNQQPYKIKTAGGKHSASTSFDLLDDSNNMDGIVTVKLDKTK
jgi:hypothetical protein